MTIRTKLLSGVATCAVAFVAFALVTWNTVNATKVTGPSYQSIVDGKDLVADILPPPEYIIESFLVAYQAVEEKDPAAQKEMLAHMKALRTDFDDRHRFWAGVLQPGPMRDKLLETSYAPAARFFEVLDSDFFPAIKKGQIDEARSVLQEKLDPLYQTHRKAIEEVVTLANASLAGTEGEVKGLVQSRATTLSVLALIALVAMAVSAFFVNRLTVSIIGRLGKAGQFANAMASGDMTYELEAGHNDEVGQLITALEKMKTSIRKMVTDMQRGAATLASSSATLQSISARTVDNVSKMSDMASSVVSATEESSSSVTAMAANVEQTVQNIESISQATEQMTSTIGEIAENSGRARVTSEQVSEQAQSLYEEMRRLGQAAQDIGKVTEAIKGIAAQTSLLALNATIEAARAGAAGKGFAVVASEVKELSQQAASATEDIKAKVASVQSSAGSAVTDIEHIATVVKDVSNLISSIATAVEEQSSVTKGVSSNLSEASTGVRETSTRIGDTATVSKQIARDVALLRETAAEIRRGGDDVRSQAVELSGLASALTATVGCFKLS